MKQSLVFVGTSSFSVKCLESLLESSFFEVKLVVTTPDSKRGRGMDLQPSPIKKFAQQKNLPIVTPQKLSEKNLLEEISKIQSDGCVVCSYGKILPVEFLNLFQKNIVNIHPSALPLWRGAAPIERFLMSGEKTSAVTLQVVGEELDAGDIISQVPFSINEDENAEEAYNKVISLSQQILQNDLVKYLSGKIVPKKQENHLATYAEKIKKEESQIDWKESAQTIHYKVRSLFLGPQAFTFSKEGRRLKIYKTKIQYGDDSSGSPGEIVVLSKKELVVSCGTLALQLLEIQQEGRQRQTIEEFLRGCPFKKGDIFSF